MDEDFEMQNQIKQSTEAMKTTKNDKTFQDSLSDQNNKIVDPFNIQMVILAWFFKISSITM